MKTAFALALLLGFMVFASLAVAGTRLWSVLRAASPSPSAEPLRIGALLDAIAACESGADPRAVGRAGERGRCQFMPTTWAQYTNAPFLLWAGIDGELTRRVERAHLARLASQLVRAGHAQPLEPALLAAAWRHGAGGAVRFAREDYAQRVANLYFAALEARE